MMSEMLERYKTHFDAFEKSMNGESTSAIHVRRREAMGKFLELGFPTTKHEEWRFTNVTPISQTRFHPSTSSANTGASRAQIEKFFLSEADGTRLVFIDGLFSPEFSNVDKKPGRITIDSLANALKANEPAVEAHLGKTAAFDDNGFVALSTAFMHDGAFIHVPDSETIAGPIQLLYIATGDSQPRVASPRNLVIVGKNAQVSIVEGYYHLRDRSYFTNTVSEIVVGEDSTVEFDRVINESDSAYHVSGLHVTQKTSSVFTSNAISLSGLIIRNNVTAVLRGEHAECTLNGLSLGTGEELIDNHTTIDHASANCDSHELYKAILDGKSRGVFNGKIFVRKDAQKTDAKQTNKTLLLSDEATIDTKPQLEIFADDVKCTHGATVGQLDDEQIFYLRARGISLDDARDLLTRAFALSVISKIRIEPLRRELDAMLQSKLRLGRLEND